MKDVANPNDVRNKMLRSHKKLVFNGDLYIPLCTQKQIEEFTRTERFYQQQYGYDTCEYEVGFSNKEMGIRLTTTLGISNRTKASYEWGTGGFIIINSQDTARNLERK